MFQESKCIGCGACGNACPQRLDLPAHADQKSCIHCGLCEEACPTTAISLVGKTMTVKEVMEIVEKDRRFYGQEGGLTFSGGEALVQWGFAAELAKTASKSYHFPVAIETTGYARWEHLAAVTEYCDEILYDIKHMDDDKHKEGTAVSNQLILENLRKLAQTKAEKIKIRIPLIDGYNADDANIADVCRLAKETGIREVHLLPYHKFGEPKYIKLGRVYEFDGRTPDEQTIERLGNYLNENGLTVAVGG